MNHVWEEDLRFIKQEVFAFFKGRFSQTTWRRPTLDRIPFKLISGEDNNMLCAKFEKMVINEVVRDYDMGKCLGPNKFNFNFLKEFWHLLKEDFLRVLSEFYEREVLPKGTNSPFISLIPKKEDLLHLGEFRPISLIGCIFNVISKLLARRIRRVLDNDERQCAFVGGNMLDGILVASEVVDEARKEKWLLTGSTGTFYISC